MAPSAQLRIIPPGHLDGALSGTSGAASSTLSGPPPRSGWRDCAGFSEDEYHPRRMVGSGEA